MSIDDYELKKSIEKGIILKTDIDNTSTAKSGQLGHRKVSSNIKADEKINHISGANFNRHD